MSQERKDGIVTINESISRVGAKVAVMGNFLVVCKSIRFRNTVTYTRALASR